MAAARAGTTLTDAQRFDWLRLIRCENVGPRTFRALVNHYGGAGGALAALPGLARRGGARAIRVPDREEVERELAEAGRLGLRFVALGEADYPERLRAIDDAPPLLALQGRAEALAAPCVAIVGSRNSSAAGLAMAERLARGLGAAGYVIVSGLARGVDQRAHAVALDTGTVGVLAGGHARPYPPEAIPLMARMVERGAVVSEMPIGWEPRGRDFPRRNRLVSGLSVGTIVVEAATRSGSLITARFAGEQGREVFAVPGSPLDPRAEGTNELLRNGATLVRDADDVIEALSPILRQPARLRLDETPRERGQPLWPELDLLGVDPEAAPRADPALEFDDPGAPPFAGADGDGARRDVAGLLGPSPIDVDELARLSGAPVRHVQTALLELELAGRLERHGGNLVSLRTPAETH
ncbi:MAG: DNA-processing protein DprA [Hyphomicrobiales bacterium]|nr:DNA-processing protein DprA [Hyphomicrobiales bacterium]MDE2016423.1 DNA-processing protein DprA [Hyphomicrobiales bacterium]